MVRPDGEIENKKKIKKDLVVWKNYRIFTKIALPIQCESSINGVSLTGHKFGSH